MSRAEYMREYRSRKAAELGGGRTGPADRADSRARALAIKWIRAQHPDVWGQFLTEARASLGMPTEIGPAGYFTKPIEHGTNAGYSAHRYRGEEPCSGCRRAHSQAAADRYQARKAAS